MYIFILYGVGALIRNLYCIVILFYCYTVLLLYCSIVILFYICTTHDVTSFSTHFHRWIKVEKEEKKLFFNNFCLTFKVKYRYLIELFMIVVIKIAEVKKFSYRNSIGIDSTGTEILILLF